MWDLVPWPGIKPGPPALGMRSLSYWTTREVPQVSEWWGCGENVICLNSRTAASFPHLRPLFRSTLESSCECSSGVGVGRWLQGFCFQFSGRRKVNQEETWALSSLRSPGPTHFSRMPNEGAQLQDGVSFYPEAGTGRFRATSAGLQKWGDKLQICIFLLIVCQSSVGQKLKEENWSGYRRRGGRPPMSSRLARSTLGSFPSCRGRGRNSPVRMMLNVRDESFPSLVYFSVLVSDLLPHRET